MSIVIEGLTHVYMQDSPFESTAIADVNLTLEPGEFVGIIGHTGSGKSTLIQHINGLLKPSAGRILVEGEDIAAKDYDRQKLRRAVGLVFQYPEHQLFEETVEKDVAFGPRNLKLPEEEIAARARAALERVGLPYEEIKDRSPFELSGGQKRRVAIAGVLAMQPSTLILDEPTAGLDPRGRDEILALTRQLHREGETIVLVTHNMSDIARVATRIVVMSHGRVAMDGAPEQVFRQRERLREAGLDVPDSVKLYEALQGRGIALPRMPLTLEQLAALILEARGDGHA